MDAQKEQVPHKEELDQANRMFHAVWKRVVPNEESCPVTLKEEDSKAAPKVDVRESTIKTDLAPTAPLPAVIPQIKSKQDDPDSCYNDFPPRSAVPFFGSNSRPYQDLLQDMIRNEVQSRHYYRSLGKRAGGYAARSLSMLCADNQKATKRLCAACFLITGLRMQAEAMPRLNFPSYLAALRERFIEEQQNAALYSAAAVECTDPWLSQLFSDLAEEKLRHAERLCQLVTQV